MAEFRIYVDGVLVNVNHNQFAYMSNLVYYRKKYGTHRVSVKEFEEVTNDDEKMKWLDNLI